MMSRGVTTVGSVAAVPWKVGLDQSSANGEVNGLGRLYLSLLSTRVPVHMCLGSMLM